MKKVIIIGCPGAGKSTFARKLKEITDLPLYYLDQFFWYEDKTNVAKDELDNKIKEVLTKDAWIMDGNYQRTLDLRMKEADTIFLLDIPLEVCISHIENRIGKEREDIPFLEDEFEEEFKQYVLDFPNKMLPYDLELIEKYKDTKDIFIFKTNEEADEYIKKLSCK